MYTYAIQHFRESYLQCGRLAQCQAATQKMVR